MINWDEFREERKHKQEYINGETTKFIEEVIGSQVQEELLEKMYLNAKLHVEARGYIPSVLATLEWKSGSVATFERERIITYLSDEAESAIDRFHELSGIPKSQLKDKGPDAKLYTVNISNSGKDQRERGDYSIYYVTIPAKVKLSVNFEYCPVVP